MIHFVNGDMFKDKYYARVNTVNCFGVMGAGLALQFKTQYPDMFIKYKEECKNGTVRPGNVTSYFDTKDNSYILNFPTKLHYTENTPIIYIITGLKSLKNILLSYPKEAKVAIPALGCGLGGADWSIIKKYICDILTDIDCEIHVFNPK